jgi:hypothetical protein
LEQRKLSGLDATRGSLVDIAGEESDQLPADLLVIGANPVKMPAETSFAEFRIGDMLQRPLGMTERV